MIAALGPVVFTLVTGLERIQYGQESGFAKHDVVGAAPIYEDVGEGERSIILDGCIYPEAVGTDGGYSRLEAARQSKVPLPLLLGDLTAVGWVLIDEIKRTDENLGFAGVGREIKFTVSLLRVGRPAIGSAISILRFL
jgi:phage protein U